MLNKNAVTNGNDCDSLMLYAEIYDDMGLHEKSVNAWFRFMDFVGNGRSTLALLRPFSDGPHPQMAARLSLCVPAFPHQAERTINEDQDSV